MENIILSASFHPDKNKWSVLIVEMGVKGTHDNYNVVYNSECDNLYFNTERQAKGHALHEYNLNGYDRELQEVIIFYKTEPQYLYDLGIRHKIVELNNLVNTINCFSKFKFVKEIISVCHLGKNIPLDQL